MNEELKKIIESERERQETTLGMIPSENFASKAVREAVGSVFMNKYAEGYANARYYEGNQNVDVLEKLCIKMVKKVMKVNEDEWHANVQVLSGSIANLAIYNSVLKPGDKIMAMYLPDGGHLSHGWSFNPESERKKEDEDSMVYHGGKRPVSFSSVLFNSVQYKTDPETLMFDYDFIEELALKEKPKMIITGGTAYPREMNYKKMREIADKVGAYYLADVSHEAGLIAGEAVDSPFDFAHFVMFTTHKTLRGPRGAVAMCRKEFTEKLDRAVFPGIQGGPFEHSIAGLTQALFEADTPEFKDYAKQIVKNCKALGEELKNFGFELVTGGTDKHLLVIDLSNKSILGKHFARALALSGIITNKTTVPYEKKSPKNPSGIRLGTPILTTRGMKEDEMKQIAKLINDVCEISKKYSDLKFKDFVKKIKDEKEIQEIRDEVLELCQKFPLE